MTYYPKSKESTEVGPVELPLTKSERRALQELADRHGLRWRTSLYSLHARGALDETLRRMMARPGAGNQIARVEIIPRSLPPVATYYGSLHFI